MSVVIAVLLVLCFKTALGISYCPQQCICSDGNIVCSCESTTSGELSIHTLGGFFARSFIVHSCTKVTVQNGSFAGVVLQDRLTFVAIDRLIIDTGAFKGIIQSPKQVVIEQCGLPRLLQGSFDGLSRLQHIWFKKSSIDTIENGAFMGVGPVDYLYFRDTSIGYLQRQAFGHIKHVRHFFFRGDMKIASSEAQLFQNSSVGELMMDDVVAHVHEAFLLDLSAPVVINNCSFHFTSRGETISTTTTSSDSLLISDSRLNTFSPQVNHLFQKIVIEKSRILKIKAPDSQILSYLPTVLRLSFKDSYIGNFESLALSHIKIAELKITDSRVGNISQSSFTGSKISKIIVEESKVGQVFSGAFVDARIEKIVFDNGKITKIDSKAFERSTIRRLEIKNQEIRHIGDEIFGELHNLTIIDSKIPIEETRPWKGSRISMVTFNRCNFLGMIKRSFLDGLTPIHLSITDSRFDCDSHDCEMNAMLMRPIREKLLWHFEGNSCSSNVTIDSICAQPSITDFGFLRCQRTALIADCVCTTSTARLPMFDVQLLVLGDCDEIYLEDELAISPTVLYLYRIGKTELLQAPASLRAVNIFHSNVKLRPGFGASRLIERFFLEKSRLYIEDGAFNHASIGFFRLLHSYLTALSPYSLEGANIEQLTINGSRIETATQLFRRTNRLSLVDSILSSKEGLVDAKFAHLANNTILCCCQEECGYVSQVCRHYFPHIRCPSASAYRSSYSLLLDFFPLSSVILLQALCI